MSGVQWIKIATNIFDNDKISYIEEMPEADTIIVIWFKLLALAGNKNDSGLIYITRDIPYNMDTLTRKLNREKKIVQPALEIFKELEMIYIENDIIAISNWEKHQNIEGLEKIREDTRKRVAKHREKQKLILLENKELSQDVTLHVTQDNDTEENRKEKNRKEKNRIEDKIKDKPKRFTPPSLQEVIDYINDNNYSIDPNYFYKYFTEGNWIDSKGNKVKNWKQKIITWNNHSKKDTNINQQSEKSAAYYQDLVMEFEKATEERREKIGEELRYYDLQQLQNQGYDVEKFMRRQF